MINKESIVARLESSGSSLNLEAFVYIGELEEQLRQRNSILEELNASLYRSLQDNQRKQETIDSFEREEHRDGV